MPALDKAQFFLRMGEHDTPTSRTGGVSTPSSTLYWYPFSEGGFTVSGGRERVDIPTAHEDKGIKYSISGNRNSATSTLNAPIFPSRAGLILNAITAYESSGLPAYHMIQRYWQDSVLDNVTGGSGAELGTQLDGCLFDSFQLDVDRNNNGPVLLNTTFYLNANRQITGTATPVVASTGPTGFQGWPTENPYTTANVIIDVAFGAGAYSGDNADVQQISVSFGNALELKNFAASTDTALNSSWTTAVAGTQTLTGSITLSFTDPIYENLARGAEIQTMKFRLMAIASTPTASTTTVESNSATTSPVVLTVASDTGFEVGDVVRIEDIDNGTVCVSTVTAVSTNTITVNKLDVAIDGSGSNAATIKNTAFEIEAPLVDIDGEPTLGTDGSQSTISINFSGRVAVGTTSLLNVAAYNDNG